MTEPKCTVPPAGWTCTRKAGHDGPCAAIATLHPLDAAARRETTHHGPPPTCAGCGKPESEHVSEWGKLYCFKRIACVGADERMDWGRLTQRYTPVPPARPPTSPAPACETVSWLKRLWWYMTNRCTICGTPNILYGYGSGAWTCPVSLAGRAPHA